MTYAEAKNQDKLWALATADKEAGNWGFKVLPALLPAGAVSGYQGWDIKTGRCRRITQFWVRGEENAKSLVGTRGGTYRSMGDSLWRVTIVGCPRLGTYVY